MNGECLTIRVGDQTYALESAAPEDLAYFARAYAACPGNPAEVTARFLLTHVGAPWQVHIGGKIFAEGPFDRVVRLLDWELSRRAIKQDSPCAAFHAAWIARDRQAAMLAGKGGAGKSHLCLQLVDHGFDYGAEDVTFCSGSRLLPFPRAIQLRKSDPILERIAPERLFVGYDGRICVEVPRQTTAMEAAADNLTVIFLDPTATTSSVQPLTAFEGLQRLFALCHRLDRVTAPLFDTVAGLAAAGRMYAVPQRNAAHAIRTVLSEAGS